MRGSGGAGNLEACRAKATPQVKACVMAALNAANGRANVAVAIPTEAAPKVPAGSALPAGFVAPPRTITDITAILDSEKPDLKTIEELKAEADAQPTARSRAKTWRSSISIAATPGPNSAGSPIPSPMPTRPLK